MLTVERVDTRWQSQVSRFVDVPFRLYAGHPQWVPPLRREAALALNRARHPFYEHSDAEFFVAAREGCDVGRIAVLENRRFNQYHDLREADFFFFDCEDDPEVAAALFDRVSDWARARGLTEVVGPKGLSAFDGYGILIKGFEHRQLMTMMNYNHPYYAGLLEGMGFRKKVDFASYILNKDTFRMPERFRQVAARVLQRGTLVLREFRSKREVVRWAQRIGEAYNRAFIRNWEYYPLTEREIEFAVRNLLLVADPRLIKIITHKDAVVGFLLAFPDVSAALQRMGGRLTPLGLADFLLERRRTKWLALNGAGILPRFQGVGGNAVLYAELERTVRHSRFEHGHLTQIAETATQMRRDLEELGARPIKNHRVFSRDS